MYLVNCQLIIKITQEMIIELIKESMMDHF